MDADSMLIREMTADDRSEVAELIYASINAWYGLRGLGQPFQGTPKVTEIFHQVYSQTGTSRCVVAENSRTGRLAGSCFYHPRRTHVGLGIMTVHPNYFGCGAGSQLLDYICRYTDRNGFPALRLTQSAMNLDSFSLYNRAGFVPHQAYQDMSLRVPESGLDHEVPGLDRIRDATMDDLPALAALEMEVSGVSREEDYRLCIRNDLGFWSVSVYEGARGTIEGFLASSSHPAFNMLGPGVIRTEQQAAALIRSELDRHRGRTPVFLVPVDRYGLVRQMYAWGARNCELHFCQVRGRFQPYQGINMPTFLLETA
jgi:GNAT superfamily N-acetyltransferase